MDSNDTKTVAIEEVIQPATKVYDIYAGIEYNIKRDDNYNKRRYNTSKLIITEPDNISVTTSGYLEKNGRKFVSDHCIETTLCNVEKLATTTSCFKADVGTQYEQQNLSADAIQRICSSKKMTKFLKNVIPILEDELSETIILASIL